VLRLYADGFLFAGLLQNMREQKHGYEQSYRGDSAAFRAVNSSANEWAPEYVRRGG
jgi:hypothetical protein